jgi:soluble lytic murein transglycosylase-like protein/tetratricopeptide (TPR) repeat protein
LASLNPVISANINDKKIELSPLNPIKGPPRIRVYVSQELKECLRDVANPEGVVQKTSAWTLTCDVSRLVEISKNLRARPSKRNLSDSLVIAKTLTQNIIKKRNELIGLNAKPSDSFLSNPDTASWLQNEIKFYDETSPILAEIMAQLTPLYSAARGQELSPVYEEAAFYSLRALAESWRFKELNDFLENQGSKVGDGKRTSSTQLLKEVVSWIQAFGPPPVFREKVNTSIKEKVKVANKDLSESVWPLRTWILKRLISQRPQGISGSGGETEFFLWTQSLFLQAPPESAAEKEKVLNILQDLWISFPKMSHGSTLRELAKYLGLQKEFQPKPLKEYSLDQLMNRAKAQVRALDSLGALRTMKRVRQIPAQSLSYDEVWDALTYHVRVLRLLDERSQIPTTLQSYLQYKDFLSLPQAGFKNSSEAQNYFSRLHELARLYWNYDDPQKALNILDKIVSKNQVLKTDYFMGPALVIRARIAEQSQDRSRALDLMDQALSSKISGELALDLLWRKVFLQLDRVKFENLNPNSLLALMEPIKKYSDRDIQEKLKWHYWYGRFLALNNKVAEAKKYFYQTYEMDLFSYYSNLAGMELMNMGEKIEDWKPLSLAQRLKYDDHTWETPNWEMFISDNGNPTSPIYKELARVMVLVRIGELELAKQAIPDLDRFLWTRILSNQISWKSRRELARSVSYLRRSMNDPMGSLRVAEIARQASGTEYDKEDYLNLYPLPFWGLIESASQKRGLNPHVVASLIRQESAFNPEAKSWANAIGLMQIIPPVAEEEAKLMGIAQFDPESLYNPDFAVQLGTHHLSRLFSDFEKSWICSIASYNAGSPPVKKWLRFYPIDIPESFIERIPFLETRNYVKSILRNYINYHRVYGANTESMDLSYLFKMPQNQQAARIPSETSPKTKPN